LYTIGIMTDRAAWLQQYDSDPMSPLANLGFSAFVTTASSLLMEKLQHVVLRDHCISPSEFDKVWTDMLVALSEAKGFGPMSESSWQKKHAAFCLAAGAKTKSALVLELQDPSMSEWIPEDRAKHLLHGHVTTNSF
jgi:hypothetical protein